MSHPDFEGWMLPEQLDWLRDQAKSRHRILEVGAWKGRTTATLADASSGKVWVVDRWRVEDDDDEAGEALQREGRDSVLDQFLMNVQPWASKLVILQMDSHEAWTRCGHLTFDMVWLDGDHRYAEVYRDIREWRSLLAPGGLLCGHDAERPDVRRAVDELVPCAKFHATKQPAPYEHRPSLIWYDDGILE